MRSRCGAPCMTCTLLFSCRCNLVEPALLGYMQVHGYAFSGGGQSIIRVDVSADGGATWTTADLEPVDRRRYR